MAHIKTLTGIVKLHHLTEMKGRRSPLTIRLNPHVYTHLDLSL